MPRGVVLRAARPSCAPGCNCTSCWSPTERRSVTFRGRGHVSDHSGTWYLVDGGAIRVESGVWYPEVFGVVASKARVMARIGAA